MFTASRKLFSSNSKLTIVAAGSSVGPILLHRAYKAKGNVNVNRMAYVVRDIDSLPQSPSARLIDRVRYPPTEIEDVVTTDIDLWEVDSNVGGFFSFSYWKSIFNFKKDYNVILHQKDPMSDKTRSFVLYEAADLENSQDAFETVCSTVNPLVDDCTLLLTEELLEEIITPLPVEPSKLSHYLVEVMQSNPNAHPDWVRVLQALALDAIGKDDADSGDTVAKLLDHGVDARASDRKGNTVLHLAGSGKSVQQVVTKAAEKMSDEERKRLLNQTNKEGKTALHTALQKGNAEVVDELIQAGADFDAVTEDEEGSNAFHVAAGSGSSKGIGRVHFNKDSFVQKESQDNPEKQRFLNALNSFNKKGFTPLMMCTEQDTIDGAVVFLQAGANPNIQHSESGNTVLHLAAEKGNVAFVKALIAFGADIDIKNRSDKTALDLASGECADVLQTTANKMREAKSRLSKATLETKVQPNSIFLLSMDGGGTRGLLHTQTLMAIQRRMKELQPNCGPVHKHFDYIAGTSSGGLVTLTIVCADATLEAARAMLFKGADEVCTLPITFPAKVANHNTQQTYGKDALMTDITTPRVIIPTVMADTNPPVLHLMTNYGEARNGVKPPKDWKVWEVSRTTSAAPFYFPPFENKFVDGGVMANNPTLDAMTEIVKQTEKEGKEAKIALVVSLGTGITPPSKSEDVGVFVPNLSNAFKAILRLPDTLSAIANMLHLFVSQATISNGQEVERARAWCQTIQAPYFRLSVPLDKTIDLAENDRAVLADLMYQGTLYLYDNIEQVDAIARLLLSRKLQ